MTETDWLAVVVVVSIVVFLAIACFQSGYLAGFHKGIERAIKEIKGE